MADDVTVTELQPGIYLASRPLSQTSVVRAALLLGERRAAVIDTLLCPEDMAPLQVHLARHGRPIIVVNTHADWDHFWGNAAFPGTLIVGHRLCRERILSPETTAIEQLKAEDPARYANAALIAPDLTFETSMCIDLGGLTLELHHLPGHTPDCLLSYVPERHLLYAGDCAEDPFPLLYSGPLDGWIAGLRDWAARDVETVVPAHGRVGGVELLRENAAYLEGVRRGDPYPAYYPSTHAPLHEENLAAARRLAAN